MRQVPCSRLGHYFKNRRILVGVTGSIAAYKALQLVSQLKQMGAEVRVVLTQNAQQFVTALSFETLSGQPVHTDLWSTPLAHIELAKWAELIVLAPATAHSIGKWSQGLADDLLSSILLATERSIVLAPAMNQGMWANPLVQENLQRLQQRGMQVLGPSAGLQACGDEGLGRMMEPEMIVEHLPRFFQAEHFAGQTILITAGPTQEPLDPVRYLSNESSGKMGYALARSAYYQGARVVLISGPTCLEPPPFCELIAVKTAAQMLDAVQAHIHEADVLISCAAVCDFRPKQVHPHKIKKQQAPISLSLEQNPDILSSVTQRPHRPFVVGFAAETENVLDYAQQKLRAKNLDMVVANQVGPGLGFDQEKQSVTIITHQQTQALETASKAQLADQLLDAMNRMMATDLI